MAICSRGAECTVCCTDWIFGQPTWVQAEALTALVSTSVRSVVITSAGLAAPKTALPATITLAPASAAWEMVLGDRPPSTWMLRAGNFSRSSFTFGIVSGMKDCPPKPGSTVITSTMSMSSMYGSTASTGVAGFRASPTYMPAAFTSSMTSITSWLFLPSTATGSPTRASMWKTYWSAPAFLYSWIHCWGLETMRWQSRKPEVCFRRAASTGWPRVMFGTKWPSMTSMCSQSAPIFRILLHSSPRVAKSAERMEGQMVVAGLSRPSPRVGYSFSSRPGILSGSVVRERSLG
mmetsp:Transcript_28887/g.81345  ORF Transcript_28887/g.81345 Transcript_28887/m.81345 type:complete len:291 (+) Transcript_28887:213-1085(+)